MRVVVIGGGVVGMTTAYSLLKDGFGVTLVDSGKPSDGIGSNVNAGLISPGHALPWASPQTLRRLPAVLTNRTPQLRVRSHLDPTLLQWGIRFLAECRTKNSRARTTGRASLGARSRDAFLCLMDDTKLELDVRHGMLFIHTDERDLVRQSTALDAVRSAGPVLKLIGRDEALAIEPALQHADMPLVGAIYHPDGITADCGTFVSKLRKYCIERGMDYLSGSVERLIYKGDRVKGVDVLDGPVVQGDEYVVSAGAHTRLLVRSSCRIDTYPVRGYGLTWTGTLGERFPNIGGVDEANLIAWSRSNNALRVTGIAEFDKGSMVPVQRDIDYVRSRAEQLFPVLKGETPEINSGFRPVTPDGMPRIGRIGSTNLIVNTGHGNLGWTMACGSAELVVDVVSGRPNSPYEAYGLTSSN